MAEKVKLSISPAVAAYLRPGTLPEVRLAGCAAAKEMATPDRMMLLFCLSKDVEPAIRTTALSYLKDLPLEALKDYADSALPNPLILNSLSRLCPNFPRTPVEAEEPDFSDDDLGTRLDQSDQDSDEGEKETINEEDEEYLSKYKMAQIMGIAEKIKKALSGDKEWRSILVKDSNKLVSGSVIKNPRITEGEILTLVKSGAPNDEIMRLICANREWIKNYKIRKALIENNRTPLQNSMKYLSTMDVKDLSFFAKSKNIASVVSSMAKRILLNKKR